jgi:DNA recombination protein RmuC
MNLPVLETSLVMTAGFLVGLLLGWLLVKYRLTPSLVKSKTEAEARLETLQNKEEEIEEFKTREATFQTEIKSLTNQLLQVSQERSAASSKLEHMASLQNTLNKREQELLELRATISRLREQIAALETTIEKEKTSFDEKMSLLRELRTSLTETYKALSAASLRENNQVFIDLAKSTFSKYIDSAKSDFEARGKAVKEGILPLHEALNRYDEHIQAMERSREKAYGGLSAQVQSLIQTQDILQKETGKLVNALRVPHIRGRWGEITLRRVAELSGMQSHCDFFEQTSTRSEAGLLRPDMIIQLPGQRQIIIDAKVPLVAYIDAIEADSEKEREEYLATHARHVKTHIHQLSQKAYWTQFTPTPEFVVLFIPGENFFSAALSKNPQLIELGVRKNVILATPTTLISLLKTVSFGWQQEKLTENARKISELGTELFERLSTMGQHINNLGRDIERATHTYNKVVGSLERRVLSSARKFKDLGITQKDQNKSLTVTHIDSTTRTLRMDDS